MSTAAAPAATTTATATDAVGIALTSLLGPWGALAALALKFGAPFVEGLLNNAKLGADPTVAEWNALSAKIEISGESLIPERPAVPAAAPAA